MMSRWTVPVAGLCPFRLAPVASAVVAVAGVPAGMPGPMLEPVPFVSPLVSE